MPVHEIFGCARDELELQALESDGPLGQADGIGRTDEGVAENTYGAMPEGALPGREGQ